MNTLVHTGSFLGNLTGTVLFLYFQGCGILFSGFLLRKKDMITRLLCGSVLGSVLLMWIPALFSFIFGFSKLSHILAAGSCTLILFLLDFFKTENAPYHLPSRECIRAFLKKHRVFLILCSATFILFAYMLSTHTLLVKEDGLHTGQCSYGDMNMHLGFITSITIQGTFPPEYSIAPGNKLCYPFLCDSISSSLYTFGASLRYAYMFPMYFAILQVMTGFYCFAYTWLKKVSKACLAWFLFFYNGGFGFLYFLDWSSDRTYLFKNIFTEFYQTPTNLINNNIRWVNIIADMLLPQRATLFGYALLFPCLWLLWRAVYNDEKDLFVFSALLTGALPMIHTHSFLAIGIISAAWLLLQLLSCLPPIFSVSHLGILFGSLFSLFMIIMQVLSFRFGTDAPFYMIICLIVLGFLIMTGFVSLYFYNKKYGLFSLLSTWGAYLSIILLLASPQLFYWTFAQTSSGSGFITSHFGWGNLGDLYPLFYLKNWGMILFLLIPAVFYCSYKNFSIISGAFLIWFIIELISFSPNTYDNNKLLYVAYAFFCCLSADFGYTLYLKFKNYKGISLWVCCFLFLTSFSAILTLARETVSDYLVYSNAQEQTALFIENNTLKDATFLTNDRHVNEVAALTGRNIVSGAGIYLGPHGIYDNDRAEDVKNMFENPSGSRQLFQKYHVNYIIISSWERGSYTIDEALFDQMFSCVFSFDDIKIYAVNKS